MWVITSWILFAAAIAWPFRFGARHTWRWSRRRSYCESCGYSLRARASDICPECGHNVAARSPLIHGRRLALHGVIAVELLVASHLFYRLEAIQKRGWIAAVPSTIVAMCVPLDRAEASVHSMPSSLERELTLRWRDLPFFADSGLHTGSDRLARWQKRWLIRRALGVNFEEAFGEWRGTTAAEQVLACAHIQGLISPVERAQAERLCRVAFFTRPVWPSGSSVTVFFDPQVVLFADGYRFRALAVTPGYDDLEFSRRIVDSLLVSWPQGGVLGVARESGPIEYELVFERFRYNSMTWEEVRRETRVVTTVSESSEHGLTGLGPPDEAIAILQPRLHLGPSDAFVPRVSFDTSAIDSVCELLDVTSLALNITVYRDGQKWGSGSGIWVSPRLAKFSRTAFGEYSVSSFGSEEWWVLPIELEGGYRLTAADWLEGHQWSIVVEGNPDLALRDFESTSYWAGRHEFRNVPVERFRY